MWTPVHEGAMINPLVFKVPTDTVCFAVAEFLETSQEEKKCYDKNANIFLGYKDIYICFINNSFGEPLYKNTL